MNLEDIQPWVASLLQTAPEFHGISILADDGTYPKTPEREVALKSKGLVLIVCQIESEGLVDDSPTGAGIEEISIAIIIEENVSACRTDRGAGIHAEKALRLVRNAILGKRPGQPFGISIRSADPPFSNLGNRNGVSRIVAMFVLQQPF